MDDFPVHQKENSINESLSASDLFSTLYLVSDSLQTSDI